MVRGTTRSDVPSTASQEKEWEVEALYGFAICQQGSTIQKVQDGRAQTTAANDKERGLHDIHRFEGWLLTCSNRGGVTEAVTVQVQQPLLQVSSDAVRIVDSTTYFYKDFTFGGTGVQSSGNPTPRVFRRFHHFGGIGGTVSPGHTICASTPRTTGVDSQRGKVGAGAEDEARVFGLRIGHSGYATTGTKRQEKEVPELMQAAGKTGNKKSYGEVKNTGGSAGQAPKHSPSSTFLVASSSKSDSAGKDAHGGQGASERQLGRPSHGGTGTMRRTHLVDEFPKRMEWKLTDPFNRGSGHLFRRVRLRVRRVPPLERKTIPEGGPRSLDGGGTTMEHKQERTGGSRTHGVGIPQVGKVEELRSAPVYRQRGNLGIHQQDGGSLPPSSRSSKQSVTAMRAKGSQVDGRTHTRSTQQNGGYAFEVTQGQIRLAPKQRSVQDAGSLVGAAHNRLVCYKEQQPAPSLRFVDGGRKMHVRGRSQESAQKGERVREPTFRHHWNGSSKVASDEKSAHSGGTGVAVAALVADGSRIDGRRPNYTSSSYRPIHTFRDAWRQVQSLPTPMGGDRISIIRELYKEKKVSEEVSEIITSRWSQSTIKNYQSIWKHWVEFARRTKVHPIYPSLSDVLQFLMVRFKMNQTAASVNHAIAALSTVLDISRGEHFMRSQHVFYFRKACNMQKPTGPALTEIWNIKLVFDYMRFGGKLVTWTRKQLLERLIVVLRIDLFARSSDLTKIYREQIVWEKNLFKVRLFKPKEWRAEGKNAFKAWSPWLVVEKLSKEPELCSFSLLKRWVELTEITAPKVFVEGEWRTPLLFKWSQGKAKPMSLEDISKITANLMRRAKVPVKFTPQSLRSAASSAAIDDGASVDRVLAQGRWSSKQLFKKYYYRPTGRLKKPNSFNMFEKLRL